MDLICKECGSERESGRRLCKRCNSKRTKSYGRYTHKNVCLACSKEFDAWRKTQVICGSCYKFGQKIKSEDKAANNYVYTNIPGRTEHRDIAESILGRKLHSNEVVHHVDSDPKNNKLENLMVMSRNAHGRLHLFLDLQRVIWGKSHSENHGNCWNTLIVPITTTWLETASVKVIKIWEIGQSAAELLKV